MYKRLISLEQIPVSILYTIEQFGMATMKRLRSGYGF